MVMGVNITDIVVAEPKTLTDFKNKMVAIDAYNTLYQFLAIIRQSDGTPLKDSQGRTTSHLSGLLYRTSNLLEAGIKPVYVFDGKPHELKSGTIEDRIAVREKAREEWRIALERGDMETAKSKASMTSRLTKDMVEDSRTLLRYMGIPFVQAPRDGEAQASFMASKGDVWAAASQDFDSLLFGSPVLIRNLTISGRRKMPRKQVYVNIEPEVIVLEETLSTLDITREQLVDMGILVGTDFNKGIKGIGPKKALKLIKSHGNLEGVTKEKGFEIPNYEEIRDIFLNPETNEGYELKWSAPEEKKIIEFLCEEHDFSEVRVESALKKIEESRKQAAQRSLDQWF